MYLLHVAGSCNPVDLFTKFLVHAKLYPLIRPLLFWRGDTQVQPNLPLPTQIDQLSNISGRDPIGSRGVTDENGTQDLNHPQVPSSEYIEPTTITVTPEKQKSTDKNTSTVESPDTVENLNISDMDIDASYMSYDTTEQSTVLDINQSYIYQEDNRPNKTVTFSDRLSYYPSTTPVQSNVPVPNDKMTESAST